MVYCQESNGKELAVHSFRQSTAMKYSDNTMPSSQYYKTGGSVCLFYIEENVDTYFGQVLLDNKQLRQNCLIFQRGNRNGLYPNELEQQK